MADRVVGMIQSQRAFSIWLLSHRRLLPQSTQLSVAGYVRTKLQQGDGPTGKHWQRAQRCPSDCMTNDFKHVQNE